MTETENIIKEILRKEKIDYVTLKKSLSGFTNIVYFVNNKYVIKIINKQTKPEKLKKEIDFYKNVNLDFIPKYITSGNYKDIDYLIIEKLEGVSLYKVWHLLSEFERESIIKQMSYILKTFHSLDGSFLIEKFKQINWKEKWNRSFDLNIKLLQEKGFETQKLTQFKNTQIDKLFSETKNGLVYNDAHFDNFIYNNGTIKLIDFDRVLYCSIDYELLIIKRMLDNPKKFANEEDEKLVKREDYSSVWKTLEANYPDMFNFNKIDDRLFVYQFFNNLGEGYEYNRNDWLDKQLKEFYKHFNL